MSISDRREDSLMRKRAAIAIFMGIIFITLMGYTPESSAQVSVNIGIGVPLPQVVVHDPPAVVVVPGTYVYFAPDVGVDIFFYHGYWYRPHHGHWYRARGYNGPWGNIEGARVPHVVRDLPPDFRHTVRHHERIQNVDLQRNWKTWEQKKHWDRRDYREEVRGGHDGGRWEYNDNRPDYRHGVRDTGDSGKLEKNQSRIGGAGSHQVRKVRDVHDGGKRDNHQRDPGGREKQDR
jgi:hypothetical protein